MFNFMWKTVSSKEVFNHPRLSLWEDDVVLPDGTETKYLKIKDDGRSVAMVIAKREDGKILLQKEYFYPPNEKIFQFPGGIVETGEEVEAGANRELMEEAKYYAHNLELLGYYYSNCRRSTEKVYVYLATDLEEKSLPGDPEEADTEIYWFSEEEIDEMIKTREINNAVILSAWCLYKFRK